MNKIIYTFFFLLSLQTFLLAQTNGHTITNGYYNNPAIWDIGQVPTGSAAISEGNNVELNSNASLIGSGLTVYPNASLSMSDHATITSTSFVNDGNFDPGDGRVVLGINGDAFLSCNPTVFNQLSINSGNLYVYGDVTINDALELTGGSAILDENGSLALSPGATVTATGGFNDNHCIIPRGSSETNGYLVRYANSPNETFFFPVGTMGTKGDKQYSPISITVASQSLPSDAHVKVAPVATKHPQNTSTSDYLKRYWETRISNGWQISSADIEAYYNHLKDISGDESNLWGGKYDDGKSGWTRLNQVDAVNHVITGAVNDLGDFTAGEFDVMPVELTSFTVLNDGKANLLAWETATETNNYGFEIERASSMQEEATPGQNDWETIGFVEGNQTTSKPNEYQFIDNDVTKGTYYYRLRQIDLDGSASYSPIINIEVGTVPKGFVLEQNYPNPFNPSTTIAFGSSKRTDAKLVVFDQLGREVETIFNGTLEENEIKKISFDASGYAGGVYYYKLITPEWTAAKKMMLLK